MKATKQIIKVTCEGAALADLRALKSLQGDLKNLSPSDYEKLKTSILRYGISFPLFVWKEKKILWTIDGHQRDKVLVSMREEGYSIPRLPIVFIHAANRKEALEKILLVSSQYGKMTDDSLYQFIAGNDLNLTDLLPMIEFPQLDMKALQKVLDESGGAGGQSVTIPAKFFVMVDCSDEEQQRVLIEKLLAEGYNCRASTL